MVTESEKNKHQESTLQNLFMRLHKRTPLTVKMMVITVMLGLIMWAIFDLVQSRKLEKIFQAQLTEKLSKQAMEDRLNFDRYVKAHLHSVKLFISQRNFGEYIERQNWSEENSAHIKSYHQSPAWFPKSSILRTFVQPRFALLLDSKGKLREVYHGLRSEQLPESLMQPSHELILKSNKQNFMTNLDGRPYLLASERYLDSRGKVKAILMLASPIDDIFLNAAIGSMSSGHVVALLTAEKDPRILTSSNLNLIPPGTLLRTLKDHYLVTGQEFFDYGASEQAIKFVSLFSMKEVRTLVDSISASERQLRILGLPVFVVSFVLLMFWVTRRIELLTQRISEFSRRTLGVPSKDLHKGDELYALEERFQHLIEEVLEARDFIKKEAEEKILLEKKSLEIKQKEKQLELLQSVTQAVGIGVIKKTFYGLVAVNQQMVEFAKMCGGISNFDIQDADSREFSLIDINGEKRTFYISSPDIFEEEKILLVQDITKIRKQTEALEHMAMHDTLTGLPNRALLHDRLQHAIFIGQRENKPLALLMMDLDRFKEINDTLGHHIGDLVLKEVGDRLPKVLRKSDTIARLGGDEFAIVLPATDVEKAKQIACKLLKALEKPFSVDGHNLYIGASIGIVFSPEHGEDASTLLQRADVAMYVAKNAQCGLSIYNPEHDQHNLQYLVLMGELKRAIENDGLTLCYQPKVSYKTGYISGVEALVRWNHPEHGFIPPEQLIPLAESKGLMKSLTMWVLNSALRQYVEWRRKGISGKFSVSINLSARSLQDSQFPEDVINTLQKWEMAPSLLEFEITESAVMADPDYALLVLKKLDEIGVRLSIDDFGTGYSSLAYLKKLPVDEIKIDQSFVMNMARDENDAMIVRSTIDLAHNLGLSVTAEGVECYEIWKMLERLGCDAAQGYYICHPLPADEFIAWLSQAKWEIEK
jgi:diguanylate cyclase (GGDEF)-like protein